VTEEKDRDYSNCSQIRKSRTTQLLNEMEESL